MQSSISITDLQCQGDEHAWQCAPAKVGSTCSDLLAAVSRESTMAQIRFSDLSLRSLVPSTHLAARLEQNWGSADAIASRAA